jgi:D-alanyl-D-alanine carboxypeptidase
MMHNAQGSATAHGTSAAKNARGTMGLGMAAANRRYAQAFETRATAAWVYDMTTQTVLLDKNADIPCPRPPCPS